MIGISQGNGKIRRDAVMLVLKLEETEVEVAGNLGGHGLSVGAGGIYGLGLANCGGLSLQVAPVLDQGGAIPEPADHERSKQRKRCQGSVERRETHAVL